NVARVETMSVTTAANVNIPIWDPELKHLTRIPLLNPAARGIIQGGSRAGPPEDKHNFHSADSFAAIEIDAFRTFVQTKVNGQDRLVGVANNTMVGGGFNAHDGGKETKDIDPLYLRVRDLDTGASITEEILTQNIFSRDATYSLTDAGLEFQINPLNPLSFVELEFHADSPWVSNPYAYGARFDSGRLTISGDRYPLADWQITQMGSRKRAFIPFGPDGSLFDMVEALPPDNLFTVGHNYQYDVGAGSGSFEIASSVPEPGSMFLVGLTATLGTTFIRRRRPK
ncbi:MAG: PEP-CTERM sorting domain-containing protein, partial [Planctomycetaceae bacterium]|nr:PEP-CTERM sorting domain-containing protein [Planctomycetaceae bacterium]